MRTRTLPVMILALLASFAAARVLADDLPQVTVYKTATCGCCGKWVEHLQASGFDVVTRVLGDVAPVKAQYRVPAQLASCHTAVVDGYVVEGHVPADIIKRLLAERPAVAGIGVPGMPAGSPGMEMGGRQDPYQVLSFDADGKLEVYDQRP